MKTKYLLPALVLLTANFASAALIGHVSYTWTGSEPTMSARLFRDGVPSTFAAPKSFPGTFDLSGPYGYVTYTYSWAEFGGDDHVTIDVFYSDASSHVVAYAGSFDPLNLAANYLGDQGSSEINFFEVILPSGSDLVVMVQTNRSLDQATGWNFGFNVLTSDAQVPEPASALLLAAGLLAGALARRRRA